MRCPDCQSTGNFATETKRTSILRTEDGLKRKRICRDCGAQWTTTERIDSWDHKNRRWASVGAQLPTLPTEAKPRSRGRRGAAAFHPITLEQVSGLLLGIPPDVCQLVIEWWNESRRSKHGGNATWTEKAFTMSVDRIKKLTHWQQILLAKAGVEHGWQSLNPSYVKDELIKGQPRQGAGFQPQSQGLAGALAIIQGGGRGPS